MLQIINKRRYTYILSIMAVLAAVGMLLVWGLKPGIDFTGGTLIEVRFATPMTQESVTETITATGIDNPLVQETADGSFMIRFQSDTDEQNEQVIAVLQSADEGMEVVRTDFIGSTVSEQLASNAMTATIIAIMVVLVYIAWAFRKISFPVSSWAYGLAAVAALTHDILIVLGIFAALGHFFNVEVGVPFVAAMLTILGYSVNDTIVVFDRVRENMLRTRKEEDFELLVNKALNQSISRSFNTSITVVIVLAVIIYAGGTALTWFAVALLIGVIAGTYSSIYVATALVVTIYQYKKSHGILAAQKKARAAKKDPADKIVA